MDELKFIIFQLGDQKYGMNLRYISGIEQDDHVIKVPNAPEGIKGIINLRGMVIPVYSLRQRFGMPATISSSEKSLLVTRSADTPLAFEVDEVIAIEELEATSICKMPSVASNEETAFMQEVLRFGEEIIIAIDADTVLSEETKQEVNQMVKENA